MSGKKIKVLFLAPYPLHRAPSQRFRFEHFITALEENAISWDFQSFVPTDGWDLLYEKGRMWSRMWLVVCGYLRRMALLSRMGSYQYVYIHRELTPFGPPLFEWFIARVFRKQIIYDFDDAIWLPDRQENPAWKWLKWRSKIKHISKWSWKVTAGNEYLASYARQYGHHVVVFPTVVDTRVHQPQHSQARHQAVTIGWTGSHSTLFYLDMLIPVLQNLEKTYAFQFVVIANHNPRLPLKNFRFVPWSKETEVTDLTMLDIGLMPLEDTEWAKGKCGFKLIQYMALGIPAVASPVGVNTQLISGAEGGFLAGSDQEWEKALTTLLEHSELRQEMGQRGRQFVVDHYSVASQRITFLSLFE